MKLLERIIYIVLIVTACFFVMKKQPEYIEIPGDTKIDTIKVPYDSLIYVTDSFYDVDTLWLAQDTAFLPSDTVKVYADYFEMHTYDSIMLKNDSSMTVWVKAAVTQNKLYDISGYFLNNRKMKIIKEDNNFLSIGAIAGANLLAPAISYDYNKHEFGIGYNVVNPALLFTYKYKIIRK